MEIKLSSEQLIDIIGGTAIKNVLISNLDNNDSFTLNNPSLRLENNYLKFDNDNGELEIGAETITSVNKSDDSIGFFTSNKIIMLMFDDASEVWNKISQFE